ncbi:hypothetical protein B0H19DRAFT_1382413 [Mycena capillaripes]|nr:hypothetical protein B0H19DRAFT_1382413 [Mycena capillaripes]
MDFPTMNVKRLMSLYYTSLLYASSYDPLTHTLFFRLTLNMPVVHYRPRASGAAVAGPVALPTTPVVATTKPVKPVPPTTVNTSTRSTAKATATTKVVPTTAKTSIPATPSVIPITSPPITTPSLTPSPTTSSTVIPTTASSSTLTSLTAHPKTTPSKVSSVVSISASASASGSTVPSPSSSTSVTALTAGIIGSLAGVALTGMLVAFFFRRWNRRSRTRESMNFDAKNFRRSAIMLDSPRGPQPPEFSSGGASIRSGRMGYQHTSMVAHPQYSYMHAPPSAYTHSPDTPNYGHAGYPIPPNPFSVPPVHQGYPPESHRQGSFHGGHPGAAPPPPPHYPYENYNDAYGGM